MKRILLLICLSLLSLSTLHAEITWSLSDDGTLTISGTDMPNYYWNGSPWYSQTGKIKKVEIKNGVTNIGDCAFYNCSCLISISIPNSVTYIGSEAFFKCSSLTSITIPYTVTSIGKSAFFDCSGLKSLTIGNLVESIGETAFYGCSSLAGAVVIPEKTKNIGERAFFRCEKISSIRIPSSVTNIGEAVFAFCYDLNTITVDAENPIYDSRNNCNAIIETASNALISGCQNTIIPNSVKTIKKFAFNNIINLISINIPVSVETIEERAFCGCSGVESVTVEIGNPIYDSRNNCNAIIKTATNELIEGFQNTEIPNTVTSIGNYAFLGRYDLSSITIPNSVEHIGKSAFNLCQSLISINIPNSVTTMGDQAFYQCYGLKSVNIGNSLTNIGTWSFAFCSELSDVTIPNSVTSIGEFAFSSCSGLTSIEIPNSVTSIEDYAFDNCKKLSFVTNLSTTPQSISSETFTEYGTLHVLPGCKEAYQNVDYWKKFTIVEDAEIPRNTIYYTSSDNKIVTLNHTDAFGANIISNTYGNGQGIITFDGDVTSIGGYAFYGCSNLTSITIPNSVTSIGERAFYFCTGLTSITIPNSVTSIKQAAFSGCSSLTSITIPNSVTSIGYVAFSGCSSLTSIIVENGNTKYDSRDNCNAIIETATNTLIAGCKNTVIPNSVTSIGNYAFYECLNLTSVTIGNSVTSIGDFAFSHCSGLTSITIPNSVTSIGDFAFVGCSDLTSVTNLSTIPQTISSGTFSEYGTLHVLPGRKEVYQKADYWNNFTIVEDAVDPFATIELADGKTYNNETTQDNKEISYTRTFGNTSWQSLYIPFSMTYEDWKDDFEVAYINGIRQMDTDDDGAIDETIMDVVKIKSGSLIPNTPYLIRAKTTGDKTFTVNNATLYKAESNSVDCSTTIAKYTFTGTYSTIPAATLLANNYYAMGGGKLIMTDGTSDLKPFRWYLNVESRSPMYNVSSGAKAITINVVGEEEATGISQMPSDRENSSTIYDLNGRRMSQKNLKSGLYIKNGKKIIIK